MPGCRGFTLLDCKRTAGHPGKNAALSMCTADLPGRHAAMRSRIKGAVIASPFGLSKTRATQGKATDTPLQTCTPNTFLGDVSCCSVVPTATFALPGTTAAPAARAIFISLPYLLLGAGVQRAKCTGAKAKTLRRCKTLRCCKTLQRCLFSHRGAHLLGRGVVPWPIVMGLRPPLCKVLVGGAWHGLADHGRQQLILWQQTRVQGFTSDPGEQACVCVCDHGTSWQAAADPVGAN
eukprot:220575-Pelagomonas_calceolata.AAC.3